MTMNIGDKKLTTNLKGALDGESGEFRVIDSHGKAERYICLRGAIVRVVPEPQGKKIDEVTWGMFSIEKLSDG